MSWTKLVSEIVNSSIWDEDDKTLRVWITLLATKDQSGMVKSTVNGLSRTSRVDLAGVEAALAKFQAPDPVSLTQEFEGRRIQRVEGGWMILNHFKYRDASVSQEAEKAKLRMREFRANSKPSSGEENTENTDHTDKADAEHITSDHIGVPNSSEQLRPTPPPKSFKQWDKEDLFRSVVSFNTDSLLTPEEGSDFIEYWMEPTATGRSRMSLEKTWDTRRRMKTALRYIYGPRREGLDSSYSSPKSRPFRSNETPVKPIDYSKGF